MNPEFWHEKWQQNDIGFHLNQANPQLIKHFNALHLKPGDSIFLPLCGKTLDIAWLLNQGLKVAGIELNEMAVKQLFAELQLTPNIKDDGKLTKYSAKNISIFVGDFFALSQQQLGHIDAVYDRAALVALPKTIRPQYSQHLLATSQNAKQLLVVFNYEQNALQGPPFAIADEEIAEHYRQNHTLQKIDSTKVEGGLKGQVEAMENVWLLEPL